VAGRFKSYGLKPVSAAGYFYTVNLLGQKVLSEQSSASLIDGASQTPLSVGQELLIASRIEQLPQVEAPLVFIGYGLHLPEANYDDFAGQDLKGKIVVAVSGGPSTLSSSLKAHARAAELWKAIERAGAVGIITIANPKSMDIPWSRQILLAKSEGMVLADPAMRDASRPAFSAQFNPAEAEKLFAKSGHTLAEMLALADKAEALPRYPLNLSLKAQVATEKRALSAPDVVAVLPGSDPKLKAEYVVLSAHLDHLGIGEPINGDAIYNGVMDNASGVASLLETARLMARSKVRPKRSVLFIAVTGEERGLLGSRAFATQPSVAKSALVADVNVDMFLPLSPLDAVVVYGREESTLGADAEAVGAAQGLGILSDPEPDRNLFVRSDQYSFIRNGIPSLSLKSSAPVGTPAGIAQKTWLTERYHGPADDLNQPVDKVSAAKLNRYLMELSRRVANEPTRPKWLETSFFKRFAK
jgi:Zn-dependent M28 family amino/carboxypeptidase